MIPDGVQIAVPANLDSILRESLQKRWTKYRKELQRCQRKYSEKSVHDLRVATRRLMSTMMIVLIIMPDGRLAKARKELKKYFDAFSPLRDTQVQLLAVEALLPTYPELEKLCTILKVRERGLMKSLRRSIKKLKTARLGKTISSTKSNLDSLFQNPVTANAGTSAALGAVASAFTTAVELRKGIRAADPETIHKLRIAFKKFRYKVEALQPLLLGVDDAQLKAMNAYQDRMGNIQDIEVLIGNVNRFVPRVRRKPGELRVPLHRELGNRKKELIREFMQSADELIMFWRSSYSQTNNN